VASFSDALQDAQTYLTDDFSGEYVRDKSQDPVKSQILAAQGRVDLVGMCIERRIYHQEMADGVIEAINCYSDSSPVTGSEIQGMLVDVCHVDGSVRRVTLAGGSVYYGNQSAIAKTMLFLWSVWLSFGPGINHMEYFISKVACWTTDNGVEGHSVELPDCLRALMAWIGGKPLDEVRPLVNFERRLFYKSLRILGWGHTWGNVMSRVAKAYKWWPEVLANVQVLCRFYRNASWREWIGRAIVPFPLDDATTLLHFTASTAKWRFETIVDTFAQLTPMRPLSEKLTEELFANAQEKLFIADVLKASRDERTWKFMGLSGRWIFQRLEHCRRWGMICGCTECNDRRKAGAKHVSCPKNGRRLADAWEFIEKQLKELDADAKNLSPANCEDSEEWCDEIRKLCFRAVSEAKTTTKYLGKVPWCLPRARTVEGAKYCLNQIKKQTLDLHDPVTRGFMNRVGNDLVSRADGGDLTTALEAEIKFLEWANLDECCGEGYHRGTNLEKNRAPSSTNVHLKQKVRVKAVIKTIRGFIRKDKERAATVVRFEYKHFLRILQTARSKRWRNTKMTVRTAMKRVYREDSMAMDNWSSIMNRVPLENPVVSESPSNNERMDYEFLQAVLVPQYNYFVDHKVERVGGDGQVGAERVRDYFAVNNVAAGNRKVHAMHTFDSADEVRNYASFAVEVQPLSRWRMDDPATDDGKCRVYYEGEAEWRVPTTMAPMDAFAHGLWRFNRADKDIENPACLILSDAVKARPMMPLTDFSIPTHCLLWALNLAGWDRANTHMTHTQLKLLDERKPYDGRESVKQQFYYMALLQLSKTLPLCGNCLPSTEPQAFYKLLLTGERTEPYLGARHYMVKWNAGKYIKTKSDLVPIEDVPGAEPIADGVNFFGNVPLALPKPKPRAHAPRGPGRGTGRGRTGSSATPPPPIAGIPEPDDRDVLGGGGDGGGGSGGDGGPSGGGAAGSGIDVVGASVGESFFDRPDASERFEPGKTIDSLYGIKVRYTDYVTTGGSYQPNWVMTCRGCNKACAKRRGCVYEAEYGVIEPLAFLHVWHETPWPQPSQPKAKTHARLNPDEDAVRRFAEENRDALMDVCRRGGRL